MENEKSIEDLRFRIRHSAAHVMAEAVTTLFPEAKFAIGPPTETGFYYDFEVSKPFSDDDLKKISELMKKIIRKKLPFSERILSRVEAKKKFSSQKFKLEIISGIPKEEKITVWNHQTWEDICRGGHVEDTGKIKAFKLLEVAGAYWRGDENREQLQRIYGTAWESKEKLNTHLTKLEEAKKRDHRRLGKDLNLFFFDKTAPSMPFFLPNGTKILNKLIDYMRGLYEVFGYKEIITPQIFDSYIWKTSGHYDHFKENMFFINTDNKEYGLKPMNCPASAMVFKSNLRSYRELPLRLSDFGRLHRYERSGVTQGLTRVRSFSQDDAHIFCSIDQIETEIDQFIKMLDQIYSDFGFKDYKFKLSLRPKQKSGEDKEWDVTESILEKILKSTGKHFSKESGEGAFYGPKIDVLIPDAIGREWQLGTVQLDFFLGKKFNLEYVNENGSRKTPIVIHRAIFGSLERFFGILIEHFGGAFPLWLAPNQCRIIPIADRHIPYSNEILSKLLEKNIRADIDGTSERMNMKIRKAQLEKIPLMIIIGDKELNDKNLSVRLRTGENYQDLDLTYLINAIQKSESSKSELTI
jgi:threonyl-tRNA synthetase